MINTIAKVVAGSRLYGLDGPGSDYDEKSIHLPELNELILRRAPHNLQRKEDGKEYESFSLQSFLQNTCTGQDVSVVMLHAPKNKILQNSEVFQFLRDNKSKFYTKRMLGSLGYAKSQAIKYSLRADRMNSVKKAIDKLKELVDRGIMKVAQAWDELPEDNYLVKGTQDDSRESDKRVWEVSGKGVTANVNPTYALSFLTELYNKYGDRVKVAANLGSHDYKSISHAFRTAYQLYHIYKDGGFEFPLQETDFIKSVKYNKVDFLKEDLDLKLNSLISEVESLAAKSNYPNSVDQEWVDEIILKQYDHLFRKYPIRIIY
jgi:hypothetical protein